MARSTASRIASKTAAAAERVVGSVTKKAAGAKKAPAKKAPAKKAPAKKAPAKNAPAKKAPAKKAPAKKATAKKAPAKRGAVKLPVLPGEDAWTKADLAQVKADLVADADRLRGEIDLATRELDGLMRDAGDGAGNDQADVGSTTFERDHELSLARNHQDLLEQNQHAQERIEDGSYGVCESCGEPIGKNRLMAFPRATLCLTCKQREERR